MGISNYYVRHLKNILIIRKCLVFSGKRVPLKCFWLSTQEQKEFCKGLALSCAGVNNCPWSSAGPGGLADTIGKPSAQETQHKSKG